MVELPGIRVSHFRTAAFERVRGHVHDQFHIFCLLQGAMEQDEGRRTMSLRPGGLRLSDPGNPHDIDFGERGGECIVVHIADPRLVPTAPRDGSRYVAESELEGLFRRLAINRGTEPARLWLDVREAVAAAGRRADRDDADPPPAWLREVREQLLDPACARPSSAAGRVSAEHLARSFRRYFGATATETRQATMLGRALALLETPEIGLADAALDAGFADQSHFTNLTRRMLGTTPGAYRARLRARLA